MIGCENLNSQMFNEFRHVGREGPTACSVVSSPLFLFPFFWNLLLREQSLALPSGGAGSECGRNKLGDFSLHVALNLVSSVAPTLHRVSDTPCLGGRASAEMGCSAVQMRPLGEGCLELAQLYEFSSKLDLLNMKEGAVTDCARTRV